MNKYFGNDITYHKFLLSTGYCCATNDGVSFIIFIEKMHFHYKYLLNRRKRNRQTRTSRQKSRSSSNNANELQFHDKIFSKIQLTCRKSLDMLKPKFSAFECFRRSCCVFFYLMTWLFYNEKFDRSE